jgi:ubiquinone biosynthesis protein
MRNDNHFFSERSGKIRHFDRYRQIALVLVKYRLGELIRILGLDKFLPFRLPNLGNPWRKETRTTSQRVRLALEELGTSFVKVGQILSTRSDILPRDFAHELSSLQSCLPPISVDVVKKVIQEELGRPVEEIFSSFDPSPVGVASIGQAHAAVLRDGREVVVKTRKPNVLEQVTVDLDILRQLAESATRRGEKIQEYDPSSLIEEVADTLIGEMDYIREGHSAEHFAHFFQDDPSIHIPKIYWEFTTPRVITLERIQGIGILDVKALDAAGFNRQELAKRSVNIWLKMVFEDAIFHADPHPGNLFVEADGRLGLIDFGMVGMVDDDVRKHVASSIKAIVERDADLLVDSLIDLGALTPTGSRDKLRRDTKYIMGHYPVGVEELNLEVNLGELFGVVRRNHVVLPSNTFLLLKTMAMVQSLGKELDPQFDFFSVLTPYVEDLLKAKYMPSSIIRRLPSVAAELALFGAGLPRRLLRIIRAIEQGELQVRTDVSGIELHLEHLERIVNRLLLGLLLAFIILGGAVVFLAFRLGS